MIIIAEHSSSGYQPRTKLNASLGDITVAFYVDPTTAGEKLTKSVSGSRYVGISILDTSFNDVVRKIGQKIFVSGASSLNIAGNGIYTLNKFDIDQHTINKYVLEVLRKLHGIKPINTIYSGGQTGVDLAGIVSASILGIDGIMTLPKGYRQRYENENDIFQSKSDVERQIEHWEKLLKI